MLRKAHFPESLEIGLQGLVHISTEDARGARDDGADVGVREAMLFEEMPD